MLGPFTWSKVLSSASRHGRGTTRSAWPGWVSIPCPFPHLLMGPEVAYIRSLHLQANIVPAQSHLFGGVSDIEYGNVAVAGLAPSASTRAHFPVRALDDRRCCADLHRVTSSIRDERGCGGVVAGQVAAEDQRRAEDAPQCHHGLLLIGGEASSACRRLLCRSRSICRAASMSASGQVPFLPTEVRPVAGVLELLA